MARAARVVSPSEYLKPIPFTDAVPNVRGLYAGRFSGLLWVDRVSKGSTEDFIKRAEAREREAAANNVEAEMA